MSLSHRIFWVLSRGGWVSIDTLASLCRDCVRPEYAVRLAQKRSMDKAEDLEEAIKYGVSYCVRVAIWDMNKQGLLEIAHENLIPSDGGRHRIKKVKLVDHAWEIVLSKDKQMLGKLFKHLRLLIEQRRCQLWIEVLPPNHVLTTEGDESCQVMPNTTNGTMVTSTEEIPTPESASPTPT